MKKGGLITRMLFLVINCFTIFGCNQNVEVINVELESLPKKGSSRHVLKYKYIPTNLKNTYYVEREFEHDNQKYFLSVKGDTTFIGIVTDNDTLHFTPYLLKNHKQLVEYDFSRFLDSNIVYLEEQGALRWQKTDSNNVDHYFGRDYANIFSDSISVGIKDRYIVNTIYFGETLSNINREYKTNEKRKIIKKYKYVK